MELDPSKTIRDENGKPNFRAFENSGLLYGLPLGLLVGVLIAGPHFYDWPLLKILGAIFLCGAGAGIVGYLAVTIAYGSAGGGFGIASGAGDDDSSGSGGHGGGGDGGGDGGGGSGGD